MGTIRNVVKTERTQKSVVVSGRKCGVTLRKRGVVKLKYLDTAIREAYMVLLLRREKTISATR